MNLRNISMIDFKFRPTNEEFMNYFLIKKINDDFIIQDDHI